MKKYYELRYEVGDCSPSTAYKDYNMWLQELRKEELLKYSVVSGINNDKRIFHVAVNEIFM